jgi:hypothetical protein
VPIKCFRRVMTQLDPSVTVLDFSDHPLLDTMLDNIPLSVSELAVFCTEKAEDAAWRALEKLAKVDLRIRRIHIGMRSTTSKFFPPFTWAAGLASIYDTGRPASQHLHNPHAPCGSQVTVQTDRSGGCRGSFSLFSVCSGNVTHPTAMWHRLVCIVTL